jgi:hypothetical protein
MSRGISSIRARHPRRHAELFKKLGMKHERFYARLGEGRWCPTPGRSQRQQIRQTKLHVWRYDDIFLTAVKTAAVLLRVGGIGEARVGRQNQDQDAVVLAEVCQQRQYLLPSPKPI